MAHANDTITIGELSRRTGVAVSALRFYEDKKLLDPHRTGGNQRRYLRSDIRRVSFILIAQKIGLELAAIEALMKQLPHGRTPTVLDWQKISRAMRSDLDSRIELLTRTRAKLDQCLGCGCLSLRKCQIYNKDDRANAKGAGPRFVLE